MAHYQELYDSPQGSVLHTTQAKSLLIIIYTALSDAQEYIIKQHGDEHLRYYLGDYITAGMSSKKHCT